MRHLVGVAIVLVSPTIAHADDTGEEHLERAEQAERAGDYVTAQSEYIAAYGVLKDAKILYYLARSYEADGQAEPAVVYYRRYLREVEVPDEHRKEVLAKIAALEPPPAPEIPIEPPGAVPVERAPPYSVPPPPAVHAPTRKKRKWYGWQIMLSDVATVILAAETESGGVFLGGYLLGPAVIHAANGNGGKALGAPALRAGLPIGGFLIGAATADDTCSGEDDDSLCGFGEALAGIGLGILAAVIIDYAWSSKTVEVPGYVTVGQCGGASRCTTIGYGLSW